MICCISPLLKNACVRQLVLDEWFPPGGLLHSRHARDEGVASALQRVDESVNSFTDVGR